MLATMDDREGRGGEGRECTDGLLTERAQKCLYEHYSFEVDEEGGREEGTGQRYRQFV